MSFNIFWKKAKLKVKITQEQIELVSDKDLKVSIFSKECNLKKGIPYIFDFSNAKIF